LHPPFYASLPTGNLIGFSSLSFMADSAGMILRRLTHLVPESGFLGQRFFAKEFLHVESPPFDCATAKCHGP